MIRPLEFAVIIAAAGSGTRMGGAAPKQYLTLAGRPIIAHTLERFRHVTQLVAVVEPERVDHFRCEIVERYDFPSSWQVVAGSDERQDSVRLGLAALTDARDIVLVHDGVRPFVTRDLIVAVAERARETGAAIAAILVKDTIKRAQSEKRIIIETIDRAQLWRAQTPQAFRVKLLRAAFALAARDQFYGTDEASLVERLGVQVAIVPGDDRNMKITTPADLAVAKLFAEGA